LDTPAATEAADAQIIAAHAGAAVIVARRNNTRQSKLMETAQSFSQTGVNIVGSVVIEH
jgi:tyrosine-protein kinase Etk/Wzc